MTDREKLVELLKHIPQVNQYEAQVQGLDYVYGCAADYLLANGVEIPVHCCDCQHCTAFQKKADSEVILTCFCHSFEIVDPTDYCSKGERKIDETD